MEVEEIAGAVPGRVAFDDRLKWSEPGNGSMCCGDCCCWLDCCTDDGMEREEETTEASGGSDCWTEPPEVGGRLVLDPGLTEASPEATLKLIEGEKGRKD